MFRYEIKTETLPAYSTTQADSLAEEERIIQSALEILTKRMSHFSGSIPFTSPQAVKDYLRLKLAGMEHEVFLTIWLDSQNRLLCTEELFRGTLTQCSVYPRESLRWPWRKMPVQSSSPITIPREWPNPPKQINN